MAREFLTTNQAEQDKKIAIAIKSREQEILAYDFELESHERSIEALGEIEWTDALLQFKGMARDEMIVKASAQGLSQEEITMIANLNALDAHRYAIQAVKIELAKSERFYNDLLVALPAGERRDTALAAISE